MLPGSDLLRQLSRPQPPKAALEQGSQWLLTCLEEAPSPMEAGRDPFTGSVPHPAEDDFTPAVPWIQFLDGLWLGRITHPALAHDPESSLLLTIRRALSRHILESTDHPARRLQDPFLVEASTLPHEARSLAICLLSLMHHPLRYHQEIVGVTVAALGRSSCAPLLGAHHPSTDQWIETLSNGVSCTLKDRSRRLGAFAWYLESLRRLARELSPTQGLQTRRAALAKRLQRYFPEARGYHAHLSLAGCPMETLIQQSIDGDPEALLRSLEGSPWTRGNPKDPCPLLRAMDFGGPMFGVFSDEERALFKAWIEAPEALVPTPLETKARQERPPPVPAPTSIAKGPIPQRRLYLDLLSANHAAEVPDEGLRGIRRVLSNTRRLKALHLLGQSFPYSPGALGSFVEQLHQKALDARPLRTPIRKLHRADWRWVLLQLTPAILVDGAWLQGMDGPPARAESWQNKLRLILEDELGQGDPEKNHANVQRQLLASLELALEDFTTEGFAENPDLIDEAFSLPNYLLAIGFHATPFTPEILGLNLAIELSGLGQGYVRVIEALEQHGINPLIIRLHLSIDNLASGHARLAIEAIESYLEGVLRREGPTAQNSHWQRVHTGFLSFRVALFGFGLALGRRLLLGQTQLQSQPR